MGRSLGVLLAPDALARHGFHVTVQRVQQNILLSRITLPQARPVSIVLKMVSLQEISPSILGHISFQQSSHSPIKRLSLKNLDTSIKLVS